MPLDVGFIHYEPVLIRPDGDLLPLTLATQALNWEEQPGELATRLTLKVANLATSVGKLHEELSPLAKLALRVDWGEGMRVLFLGTVEEWEFDDNGVETLTVTAYDELFAFAQSEDEYLIVEGSPANTVLRQILTAWGFTIGDFLLPGSELPKMRLDNELANSVFTILTEVFFAPNGGEYFLRARYSGGKNVIDVIPPGHTEVVYRITPDVVARFNDKQSTKDLVNQIHLLGNLQKGRDVGIPSTSEDAANLTTRPRIDHFVTNSDLVARAGRRRRLVKGQEGDTIDKLQAEGARVLARYGEPERKRTVTLPDIPYLRKGDALYLTVGTVDNTFFVTGVSHDADSRTMQIEYDSSGTFEHRNYRGEGDDSEARDVGIPSETQPGFTGTGNTAVTNAAKTAASTGTYRTDDQRLLTDDAIAQLALKAGVPKQNVAVAVAVCLAESTGFPGAVNNSNSGESAGSRDRGLWQINSKWHPEVSDQCAFDPECNARAMAKISKGGTAWGAWAAYNNGSYRQFMGRGQAAAAKL